MRTIYQLIFLLIIILIAVLLFYGCKEKENKRLDNMDSETPVKDAWINLADSTAWHTYGKTSAGAAWKFGDSMIYLHASDQEGWQTKNGGDLVTNEEFENFHLKLEWKISEAGNSGIMFYVKEDTSLYNYPWETGPEMQVTDNEKNPDGKVQKWRAGDLYDLLSISKDVIRKAGEWNQVEIIADTGNLSLIINGEPVLSTQLWKDEWKKLIAGSKFKDMPAFGTFKKGRIGLQDHGADVWYRNIMIRKL